MAVDPAFASTPALGAAILGNAETSLTVPTLASVVITAATNGTKIEEVVVHAVTTSLTPTTVAGFVYLFIYDTTTYHLFDTLPITAVTASATTTAPFRLSRTYTNLLLEGGWSLRASNSIAGNANLLKVTAIGGDY
jgi:hypothetical protein